MVSLSTPFVVSLSNHGPPCNKPKANGRCAHPFLVSLSTSFLANLSNPFLVSQSTPFLVSLSNHGPPCNKPRANGRCVYHGPWPSTHLSRLARYSRKRTRRIATALRAASCRSGVLAWVRST